MHDEKENNTFHEKFIETMIEKLTSLQNNNKYKEEKKKSNDAIYNGPSEAGWQARPLPIMISDVEGMIRRRYVDVDTSVNTSANASIKVSANVSSNPDETDQDIVDFVDLLILQWFHL